MDVVKSKSFWSSIAVILAMVIVAYVPELASSEEELIAAFTAIGVALVAGHKLKDMALAFFEAWINKTSLAEELDELSVEADTVNVTS